MSILQGTAVRNGFTTRPRHMHHYSRPTSYRYSLVDNPLPSSKHARAGTFPSTWLLPGAKYNLLLVLDIFFRFVVLAALLHQFNSCRLSTFCGLVLTIGLELASFVVILWIIARHFRRAPRPSEEDARAIEELEWGPYSSPPKAQTSGFSHTPVVGCRSMKPSSERSAL